MQDGRGWNIFGHRLVQSELTTTKITGSIYIFFKIVMDAETLQKCYNFADQCNPMC